MKKATKIKVIPSVGVIGCGFVGSAIIRNFSEYTKVYAYDVAKELDSYTDVIAQPIIFVCLPTPMLPDGNVDTSIVQDALQKLANNLAGDQQPVVVLKSTVPPDALINWHLQFSDDFYLVFSPEFLTERTAQLDFQQSNRMIFGYTTDPDAMTFTPPKELKALHSLFDLRFPCVPFYYTSYQQASLVKYFTNVYFASRLSIMNEYAKMCEAYNLSYSETIGLVMLDQRIARSHYQVPGHDGHAGWGGSCLTPDTMVLTKNGLVELGTIKQDDALFDGHKFTKVTRIANRGVNSTIEVTARGVTLNGSEDHIHLVYEEGKLKEKYFKDLTVNDWVFIPEISKISAKSTFTMPDRPVSKGHIKWWPKEVEITKGVARLIGLYLAEGFSGCYWSKKEKKNSYIISWSFGHHERTLANETAAILASVGVHSDTKFKVSKNATFGVSKTWVVRARSKGLYTFFTDVLKLGKGAHTKMSPIFTGELAASLIGGWLDGDGSQSANSITGFSRSKNLISAIMQMSLSLGTCPAISQKGQQVNFSMREDVDKVRSWTKTARFNQQTDAYVRKFSYESPKLRKVDNGWITKITKINRKDTPATVVSLDTESKMYTANGILTHNCFVKDINGFIKIAESMGVSAAMARAAWNVNLDMRPEKDWEKLVGRAVSKTE